MNAIWTGLVAGIIAFAATLVTHFLTRGVQRNLLDRELEHQTRAALRQTYDKMLVSQRRSREASLRLLQWADGTEGAPGYETLVEDATAAHAAFLEHYHQLNLDASPEMWIEARGLRHVLDDMLKTAQEHQTADAQHLSDLARDARQNLEGSFRLRLGYEVLQERKGLPHPYDKMSELEALKERSKAGRRAWPLRARLSG
jgi:hypothetical protein